MIDQLLVLDFKVRRPDKDYKSETVLIPMWVYGIVAPIAQKNQLNFIEMAVLGLCQLNTSQAEISAMLDLHPELLRTVLRKFEGQRYIDPDQRITAEGKSYLKSGELDQIKLTTGFIFQNAISGDLCPCFVEELPYTDTISGTKLRSLIKAQSWDPNTVLKLVNRLLKKQNKKSHHSSSEIKFSDTEEINTPWKIEKPQLMYFKSYIYLPEDASNVDFRVTDPFSEDNSQLRALLWNQRTQSPLKKIFERLFAKDADGLEQVQAYSKQLAQRALLRLEGTFGLRVNESPLLQVMLDAWGKRIEIEEQREYGWQIFKVKELCLSIRIVIERAIKDARKQFVARAWSRVQGIKISKIIEPIFEKLTGRSSGDLKYFYNVENIKTPSKDSLWNDSDSMRNKNEAIIALLIEADTQGSSFMYAAFQTYPDLLERFNQVFKATNANLHDSKPLENPLQGFDDLDQLYESTEITLSALLRLEKTNGETNGKE